MVRDAADVPHGVAVLPVDMIKIGAILPDRSGGEVVKWLVR